VVLVRRILVVAGLCVTLVVTLGCGAFSTPKKVWTRNFESYPLPVWTDDGLYLVSGRSGALFLSPAPLDLSGYRGVVVDDIQITTKSRSRALRTAEQERLAGYFTRRLKVAFESIGWPIVESPGPDVLRARVAVLDLDLKKGPRSETGLLVLGVSGDRIAIIVELRDPANDQRRLLYGDRRRLPFGTYQGSDAISLRRVEDAFYYFSIDLQQRLDQVRRGLFPPPEPPPRSAVRGVEAPGWRDERLHEPDPLFLTRLIGRMPRA